MLRVKLYKKSDNRKRKYRQYDMDALTNAFMAVKEENMPVKKAARVFGIPEITLRQRVIGAVDFETVRSGPNPLLSMEQEARLVNHVTTLANVGYGYTRPELCNLATEFAVHLGLRDKEHPLSLQWYRNFITRWPNLAVKKPRSLAIARAKATSEEKVTAYFKELEKILDQYNLKDKPQNIYNIDEKGISDNHCPPKVVADKNTTPYAVTSGMSYTVTVLGAGNALGTAIPPFFIFPGSRMRSELLEGASTGANGTVSKTGWCNGEVFKQYLETHFIKFVQGRDPSEPLLLLYDGHRSHISLGIIEWARQQNIILFVLPPHTSHVLQPLDVGCFGPFQKIYNNVRAKFMRENSVSSIPKHSTCELGCRAYSLSVSAANLRSSFQKCGIYPFNPVAVDRMSFIPSTVFQNKPPGASDAAASHDGRETDPGNIERVPTPPLQTDNVENSDHRNLNDQASTFFQNKEVVLLNKSTEPLKKRKVLSSVVGGKPITEEAIVQKIQDHQKEVLSKKTNKKVKTNSEKVKKGKLSAPKKASSAGKRRKPDTSKKSKVTKFTPPFKFNSEIAGPSGVQVINVSDHSNSDDSKFVEDGDPCCVCQKWKPDNMNTYGFLEFLKWGECTFSGCKHWVHLKYCTPVRVLRRHDEFHCPCHAADPPCSNNVEE